MRTRYNPEDFGKVVVLMGGDSSEREISLASGKNVLEALLRAGIDATSLDVQYDIVQKLLDMKPDRAFIALHGPGGEDGTIQGVLENLGIFYTGSNVAASAVTMDKTLAKLIWHSIGILTPRFRTVTNIDAAIEAMQEFSLPICVKPAREGSSIGVSKVSDSNQLTEAFNMASQYDRKVIIEPWIEGTEYTVGILGTDPLPIIEIQTPHNFYDFDAKYNDEATKYICPCNLSPERETDIQTLAFHAFAAAECSGWGRVDLIEDFTGNLWFLEVNTVPGLTDQSLLPKAAKVLGIDFDELVIEILSYTLPQKFSEALVAIE